MAPPDVYKRQMFPLLAKKNGVLERNGHTEATVDLCRLAGLKECGLCCFWTKASDIGIQIRPLPWVAIKSVSYTHLDVYKRQVVKEGRIIGQGWHQRYGQAHAERNALASCTEDPQGARCV